jgi:hypothetical protein
LAYPLGVGPLVWLNESGYLTNRVSGLIFPVFKPVFQLRDRLPEWPRSVFDWYLNFWKGIASDPIPQFGMLAGICVIVLLVRVVNRRRRSVNPPAPNPDATSESN